MHNLLWRWGHACVWVHDAEVRLRLHARCGPGELQFVSIGGALCCPPDRTGALCCPPDRPGALRGASGRCTSVVSWCVGATGSCRRGSARKSRFAPKDQYETSRGAVRTTGQENDDTTRVKREQQDRAPAPTSCTPARPTRRDLGRGRRSELTERGSKPCVSDPRCSLRGRPACGWHSATGEQSASSRQTAVEQRAARRSATSRSPRRPFRRLIRTDREWPATLRRP
jgi:hypothetical protein